MSTNGNSEERSEKENIQIIFIIFNSYIASPVTCHSLLFPNDFSDLSRRGGGRLLALAIAFIALGINCADRVNIVAVICLFQSSIQITEAIRLDLSEQKILRVALGATVNLVAGDIHPILTVQGIGLPGDLVQILPGKEVAVDLESEADSCGRVNIYYPQCGRSCGS